MKKIVNKNAYRKVAIEDRLLAGIALTGAEAKAIRTRGVDLKNAFVQIQNNQAFLINAIIHPYPYALIDDQEPGRKRKLLLTKKQIKDLISAKRKKLTIIPTACYTKGRWIKIELGIGKIKGKKQRKQDLIEKDLKRRIKRYT